MVIDMLIFMMLAMRYTYEEHHDDGGSVEVISNVKSTKSKSGHSDSDGHSNAAYIE